MSDHNAMMDEGQRHGTMNAVVRVARNQIRGVTGALLVVGLTFHYTMETWWLGWTLPMTYLIGYVFIGLALIVFITRNVGFREEEQGPIEQPSALWRVVPDFAELLLQSFVASYAILLSLGVIDLTSSLNTVVRLGLIEVVPLGFGAALANRLFGSGDGQAAKEGQFPKNVAIFAVGSLFVASTIAPTQEVELIASHMGWPRHALLVALTLVLVYLILYELEFKGQQSRLGRSWHYQVGTVFIVYFVGASLSFLMLLGFGHFIDGTVALIYQDVVVLAFPASLGGAAAEVVI